MGFLSKRGLSALLHRGFGVHHTQFAGVSITVG
jgi:hypothetical protein